MGWIPYFSVYCKARVDSYCYVLSYQAFETDPTKVPKRMMLTYSRELSGMSDRRPGSLSQVAGRIMSKASRW
jgi:hypothetical protein